LNSYYEQIEVVKNEIDEFRYDTRRLQSMSTQNLQKEQMEYEQVKIQLEGRHNEFAQNLMHTIEMIVDCKENIQRQVEKFKAELASVLESV